MNKLAEHYLEWNERLYYHFFPENNNGNEVLLYVDDDLLDDLGQDLGGHADFLKTVILSPADRTALFQDIKQEYLYTNTIYTQEKKYLNSNSILYFATLFTKDITSVCNKEENLKKYVLFFNYIILVIYLAVKVQDKRGNNIGDSIRSYLKQNITGENGRYDFIETLFSELHKFEEDRFKNENLIPYPNQKYVGLIKYQLFFTTRQIDELKKALYQSQLDDDLSFEEKLIRLKNYANDNWKEILDVVLETGNHRQRIESIINNFDPEEYHASHQTVSRAQIGSFRLALCPRENIVLLFTNVDTSFNVQQGNKDFEFHVPESGDNFQGYYFSPVKVNGNDRVSLSHYQVKNGEFNINGFPNDKVLFFKKISKRYYLQTRILEPGVLTYIVVHNDAVTDWELWMNANTEDCINVIQSFSDKENDIRIMIGKNHTLYRCSTFKSQYYQQEEEAKLEQNNILRTGGIQPPRTDNVYLISALPYFKFPETIDKEKLKVYINIENRQLENDEYNLITNGNRLFIDIHRIDLDYSNGAVRVDYNIEYKNYELKENNRQFYICGQDVKYTRDILFKFNKWGELANDENTYLQGNNAEGITHTTLSETCTHLGYGIRTFNYQEDLFYFINLLSAICFMSDDKVLSKNKLERCIDYSSRRMNIDLTEDENLKRNITNLLINSGYICPKYDRNSRTIYQPVPPTFIKIPFYKNKNALYMLIGCYTQKFLTDLNQYCRKNNISLYTKDYDEDFSAALRFLPPLILLESNFKPDEFKKTSNHDFECQEIYDYVADLLSLTAKLSDYQGTLKDTYVNLSLCDTNETQYPRLRIADTQGYGRKPRYIEIQQNQFKESSVEDEAWMELYCKKERKEHIGVLHSEGDNGILHLFIPIKNHLPYLLQRALYVMNLGSAHYRKVFICNNTLVQNAYYIPMKCYDLYNTENYNLLNSVLSASDTIRNVQKPGLHYTLELHEKVDDYSPGVNSFMSLKRNLDDNIVALVAFNHVYVRRNGAFKQVDGKVNTVLSEIFLSSQSIDSMVFPFVGQSLPLPNIKKYYKSETIEIYK